MPTSRDAIDEQLRDKALLSLEDAAQECRYRTPRPSYAVRFALAYLWVYGGRRDRGPFDSFWLSMRSAKSPWSFGSADSALAEIYRALGVERPDGIGSEMWRQWEAHEGRARESRDRQ